MIWNQRSCRKSEILGLIRQSSPTKLNEAFSRIMHCFYKTIAAPPRRSKAKEAQVKDHVQNVLLRFFQQYCREPDTLEAESLLGLLKRISETVWINELKSEGRRKLREQAAAEELLSQESESSDIFEQIRSRITPGCWRVIRLRLVHARTFEEIRELSGENDTEKVRRKYYRCIDAVRNNLQATLS